LEVINNTVNTPDYAVQAGDQFLDHALWASCGMTAIFT